MREHHAVAVHDDAAVGHDRHDGDAVRFGERVIVVVLHDLEVDETRGEHAEHQQHEHERDRQAHAEAMELELGVRGSRRRD